MIRKTRKFLGQELFKLKVWATKEPTLFVYSYGGNGTRMFYEFVKGRYRVNEQASVHGKVHKWIPSNAKAILIIGNPIDSVKSFYRKQGSSDSNFIEKHCLHLGIDDFGIRDLKSYARAQKDLFQLESYWDRIIGQNRTYDLMVVKFEALWDNLGEVFSFLEMEDSMADFPAQRSRSSSLKSVLTEDDIHLLKSTYASFQRKLDNSPDIFVIGRS